MKFLSFLLIANLKHNALAWHCNYGYDDVFLTLYLSNPSDFAVFPNLRPEEEALLLTNVS